MKDREEEVEAEEEVATLPEVDMAASEVEEEAVVVEEADSATKKIEVDTRKGKSSPPPIRTLMTTEVEEEEEEAEVEEAESGT